jgi:hypothetical protein
MSAEKKRFRVLVWRTICKHRKLVRTISAGDHRGRRLPHDALEEQPSGDTYAKGPCATCDRLPRVSLPARGSRLPKPAPRNMSRPAGYAPYPSFQGMMCLSFCPRLSIGQGCKLRSVDILCRFACGLYLAENKDRYVGCFRVTTCAARAGYKHTQQFPNANKCMQTSSNPRHTFRDVLRTGQ